MVDLHNQNRVLVSFIVQYNKGAPRSHIGNYFWALNYMVGSQR